MQFTKTLMPWSTLIGFDECIIYLVLFQTESYILENIDNAASSEEINCRITRSGSSQLFCSGHLGVAINVNSWFSFSHQ